MDLRVGLVDDVGTELGESVDDPVHGVLVARNEARGQDDGIPRARLDLVVEIGHAREHGHRLALRPCRHVHDLIVGKVARLLVVDQQPIRNLQVAKVLGDRHVAHHAATEQREPAPVRRGGIHDLLHAVDVAGEAGDDDPARCPPDDLVQNGPDLLLERRESGDIGVGGVDQKQVDPGFAETRECPKVGEPAVQR